MELVKRLFSFAGVMLALFAYFFVVISAIEAAVNHEWVQGCFWMLVVILFRIIDMERKS